MKKPKASRPTLLYVETSVPSIAADMTWREIALVLLMATLVLGFTPSAHSCDCVHYGYQQLKRQNMKVIIPAVVIGSRASYRGGVVTLTNTTDCRVFAHELVHAWQDQKRGPARNAVEWELNEREAAMVVARMEEC